MNWHDSVETLLCEICDEAQLRSSLHMKQHISYRKQNQFFSIPIVIFSAISGSGNFMSNSYSESVKETLILCIGALSIFTSIVSAIAHHLKLSENSESNRIASLQWGKYFARLRNQLYLQRCDRDPCQDFMVSIFADYERLFEISPVLMSAFIKKVKNKLKKRQFPDDGFQIPFYLNGFQHIKVYESWEENTFEEKQNV